MRRSTDSSYFVRTDESQHPTKGNAYRDLWSDVGIDPTVSSPKIGSSEADDRKSDDRNQRAH
jgi:hypothetical protein